MASSWIPCPKGFKALRSTLVLSLRWSLGCGTLIIADKWKSLPTSNGVICFPALTQKWQQRKRTLCSAEFHYSAANRLELLRTPTSNAAPSSTCTSVCVHHKQVMCICVHAHCKFLHTIVSAQTHACVIVCACAWISTVYESVQIRLLSVKTGAGSCSRRSFSKDLHPK